MQAGGIAREPDYVVTFQLQYNSSNQFQLMST